VTLLEGEEFAFRTPSLLNITKMGPVTIVGSYLSLEATVRHHLNVSDAVCNDDITANIELGGEDIRSINLISTSLPDSCIADTDNTQCLGA
jgi:cytochrome c peroxidase